MLIVLCIIIGMHISFLLVSLLCGVCPYCPLSAVFASLFFLSNPRTALIVGGGDGVGKLHDIATKVRERDRETETKRA